MDQRIEHIGFVMPQPRALLERGFGVLAALAPQGRRNAQKTREGTIHRVGAFRLDQMRKPGILTRCAFGIKAGTASYAEGLLTGCEDLG